MSLNINLNENVLSSFDSVFCCLELAESYEYLVQLTSFERNPAETELICEKS